MLATMSEAHREWHHNTGVPVGQPGCPQDACHPHDYEPEDLAAMADPKYGLDNPVKCGRCSTRQDPVYHEGPQGVRSCALDARPAQFGPPSDEPLFTEDPTSIPALTGLAALRSKVGAEPVAPERPRPDLPEGTFLPEQPLDLPEPDWSAGINQAPSVEKAPEGRIYDGIYTVQDAQSDTGHRTFRVRTQGKDESFAPGQQVVAYLSGPDNGSDYTGFAFLVNGSLRVWAKHHSNTALRADAATLLADPDAAVEAVHCSRCHRLLTVPASVHDGVGPECSRKMGR